MFPHCAGTHTRIYAARPFRHQLRSRLRQKSPSQGRTTWVLLIHLSWIFISPLRYKNPEKEPKLKTIKKKMWERERKKKKIYRRGCTDKLFELVERENVSINC